MGFLILCLLNGWSPDTAISGGYTCYSSQHSIVCGASGGAHAVWFNALGGPRYSVSYNCYTGSQWTIAQKISAPSGLIFARHPCVAAHGNNLFCVWESGWGCSDIVLRRFYQGNWDTQVTYVSKGTQYTYSPSVSCDARGVAHFVWEKGYEIHYRNMEGAVLSDDTVLSNSNVYAAYPVIATHGDNIYVGWEDLRDGNFEIYLKEFDGTQWSEDKKVTNSAEASLFPSLCVDYGGVVHVVWQEDGTDGYQISYASYEDGDFDSPVPLIESPGEAIGASIASAGEELHLVWSDSRDGGWEIYYRNRDGAWKDDTRLTHSEGTSGDPSICASNDGSLYVLFWDTRDGSAKVHFMEREGTKKTRVVTRELTALPNPFTDKTVMEFEVWSLGIGKGVQLNAPTVTLSIYDIGGRLVRSVSFDHSTIQPLRRQSYGASATFNQITWDGTDDQGVKLDSGVYFAKVTGAEQKSGLVRKVVLLR